MVIKYAIRDKLIYKVELIHEKQNFTFLRFHGKTVCVGGNSAYFDTEEEARNYLLEKQTRKIKLLEMDLETVKKRLDRMKTDAVEDWL